MKIYFKAISAEAKHPLSSFDKALYKIGLANANIIKLSSVMPENAEICDVLPRPINIGEIIKAVYISITTNKGIAACGLALGKRKGGGGLFYEYSAYNTSADQIKSKLKDMIEEAFQFREWELESIEYAIAVAEPKQGYATALSVAAFFD